MALHFENIERTNEDRAESANTALQAYAAGLGLGDREDYDEDPLTALGDLVADLRHLAERDGVSFCDVLYRADLHFSAETEA